MLLSRDAYGMVLGLFFCHDAIPTAALRQCSLPQVLVGDMQSLEFFIREAPALAPHVDKATLIALTQESGDRSAPLLSRSSDCPRDEIVTGQNFKFLGIMLDGISGRLRHTGRRCWCLRHSQGYCRCDARHRRCPSRAWETPLVTTSVSSHSRCQCLGRSSRGHSSTWVAFTHSLFIDLRVTRAFALRDRAQPLGRSGRNTVLLRCIVPRTPFSSRQLARGKQENSVGGRDAGGSGR